MTENAKTIDEGIRKFRSIVFGFITLALEELALKAIDEAHKYKKYVDRTFNLHDSYGYGIYYGGDPIKTAMTESVATKPDTKGTKGHDIGLAFLDSYRPISQSWVLVIVAGEFYAEEVDAVRDGLRVLSGAYQYTDENFEGKFKRM